MTDVVLVAVIVVFFLGAAWLVTGLGRVTAGARDDESPPDDAGGEVGGQPDQPGQLTGSGQPR